MAVKIIACEVMKEEILSILPVVEGEYEFVSMGLHLYPEKLGKELQNIINRSKGFSRIILAFGLCGGAAKNLQAMYCTLTIPKVHDCISIFLCPQIAKKVVFEKEIGTFYLSYGWVNTEKSVLSEHKRVRDKYGEQKALKILSKMYDSYKKVLFIKTQCSFEKNSINKSKEIANLLKLNHEIIQGSNKFIEKIVKGPWEDSDFINIDPLDIIREEDFGIC